jgi:hypothetical protein
MPLATCERRVEKEGEHGAKSSFFCRLNPALRQNISAQDLLRKERKSGQLLSEIWPFRSPQVPSLFQMISIQYRLTCKNVLKQDATRGEWMPRHERKDILRRARWELERRFRSDAS